MRKSWTPGAVARWLLDEECGTGDKLLPRWLFLRALGLIYFSAFFSLVFQIRGLIGPDGILPASEYLKAVAASGHAQYWYAPTLLWVSSSGHALDGLCWVGLVASALLALNILPRWMLMVCFVCFISFVSAASEFAGYQSDGMLLEAGFLALFVAPDGFRPGLAHAQLPMRASVWLLLWEWFRIYFESGVAKIASGDTEWRRFTAMDEYYQNGPLPTWIGWSVHHFPHWFHAATAFGTLALELVLVCMLFLPRRWRIVCFFIVTPWQVGVILTANYTFLNYLVLALGIFLIDDRFLRQFLPKTWRAKLPDAQVATVEQVAEEEYRVDQGSILRTAIVDAGSSESAARLDGAQRVHRWLTVARRYVSGMMLGWMFYASTFLLIVMLWPGLPLPTWPVVALQPFRIAEQYGLFAVMTRGRYEIEFQGSTDGGKTWVTYPFRYKPQDPVKAPRIYAPYQPRFDWNLWFASLGGWRSNPMVARTEERLLNNNADVLKLFAGNPFVAGPPSEVRSVVWQYWFSTAAEKKEKGIWWRREMLGLYAPTLEKLPNGRITVAEWPKELEPRE